MNWGGGMGSASWWKIPTFATDSFGLLPSSFVSSRPCYVVIPMPRVTLVCPTASVVATVLPDGEVWLEPVLRLSEG